MEKILIAGRLYRDEENGAYDIFTPEEVVIPAGEQVFIPLGIYSAFSPVYRIQIRGRSGLAKKGLLVLGGLIDSGYRGQWHLIAKNLSSETIVVPKGKAICQATVEKVPKVKIVPCSKEFIEAIPSERKDRGFGSSD
jgi:dUTP pyrophosphatase